MYLYIELDMNKYKKQKHLVLIIAATLSTTFNSKADAGDRKYEFVDSDIVLYSKWVKAFSAAMPELEDAIETHGADSTLFLYDTQIDTATSLILAAETRNATVLTKLARLYSLVFAKIGSYKRFAYYYTTSSSFFGIAPRISYISSRRRQYAWLAFDANGEPLPEDILSSAQFLYASVRLLRATEDSSVLLPANFTDVAWSVTIGHLKRWIAPAVGDERSFQRVGWGCGKDVLNHSEHIKKLIDFGYGRKVSKNDVYPVPLHCNAISDTDIWIILAVAEVMMLSKGYGGKYKLKSDFLVSLAGYLEKSFGLIKSRLTATDIGRLTNKSKHGMLLDAGLWRDHPDYIYSDYTGTKFPGWKASSVEGKLEVRSSVSVGWDLSHARRFVQLTDTVDALFRFKAELKIDLPIALGRNDLDGIARQTVLGTWNGSIADPRFKNYLDGSNGWFRVNYRNRPNFGYPPYGLDSEFIYAGFSHWAQRDKDIRFVIQSRINSEVSRVSIDEDLVSALKRQAGVLLASIPLRI